MLVGDTTGTGGDANTGGGGGGLTVGGELGMQPTSNTTSIKKPGTNIKILLILGKLLLQDIRGLLPR